MRRIYCVTLFMLPLLMVAACQHQSLPAADSPRMIYVSGQGRLLSVDQVLGIGTLNVDGRIIRFSWKNEAVTPGIYSQSYQDASGLNTLSSRPVTTDSNPESRVTPIPLEAQVGDTIVFRGYMLHGEIMLSGATAIKQ